MLGHVCAVNSKKKDGRVKAQQIFKKNASKVRQNAAAKPKKVVFIVVANIGLYILPCIKQDLWGMLEDWTFCKCLSFEK